MGTKLVEKLWHLSNYLRYEDAYGFRKIETEYAAVKGILGFKEVLIPTKERPEILGDMEWRVFDEMMI